MKLRFVHCSDLHLGAPYSMLPREAADRRRADQRETFARIVDLAIKPQERADLLLLTGDTFDSANPSPRDVGFLRGQLQRLADAGVKTFAIPGNHDPWREKSFWAKAAFPFARFFRNPVLEQEELRGLGISVWAIAPDSSNLTKNQLAQISMPEGAGVSLLMCHGSWLNFGSETADCHPFSTHDVRNLPFAYVALGHYHACRQIEGPVPAAYPGTPEALGFSRNDLGDRHVVIGTIADGKTDIRFHKINIVSHVSEEFDCTAESYDSLRRKVESILSPSCYVRIQLKGCPSVDVIAGLERLKEELSDMCAYLRIDSPFSSVGDVPADNVYLKRFMEKMKERIGEAGDERKPLLNKALELGIRAFARNVN